MNIETKIAQTEAEAALKAQFEVLAPAVTPARRDAFARIVAGGLPNRRVEAWHYTDLRGALRQAYAPAAEGDAKALSFDRNADVFATIDGPRLVIVNGMLRTDLSDMNKLPGGVDLALDIDSAKQSAALVDGGGVIGDLNLAFASAGFTLRVAENASIDVPIHLIFVNGGGMPLAAHSRVLIEVGAGASCTFIESHVGEGASQTTHVADILVGDKTAVDHVCLQAMPDEAHYLSVTAAKVGADSRFNSFLLNAGGRFSRCEAQLTFAGEHSTGNVSGAVLLRDEQFCDGTIFVDHAVPHCASRELYKFVLDGKAHGVFQGQILVRPHAQKTDGKQSSHALLLSEQAEMNAKPELEIYADDVQCGHGSTAGQLDEDLMFYLRARGIPEKEAKSLLVLAFIGDALEEVVHEDARAALLAYAERWLAVRG